MNLVEGYLPGGRWERILGAIEHQPLRGNEIARRTRDGRYSMNVEKTKVWRAVTRMRDLGLVDLTDHGAIATAAGREALRADDFQQETERG